MRSRVDLRLRAKQALAVARWELRTTLSLRTGLWLYFVAFVPVVLLLAHALLDRGGHSVTDDTMVLAGIFQVYYLRMAIFFACLGLFGRLFRGEMVQRTLHYLLLAPLRREVLVAGKYLAAAFASTLAFGLGVGLSFAITYVHAGRAGSQFVWYGGGLGQLGSYLLVTVLACLGYGAVFLLMGLLLRNPALPALFLLGWETFSGVLPAWLQRLSVTFYLKPLLPVGLPDEGPGALFSVVVEPVRPWIAVLGLLLFACLVVAAACWRLRRVEINYAAD
jgi:ABC-type transport system involved in multi-copper enzyme maturation permease subunit